jgi:hypothetical protein
MTQPRNAPIVAFHILCKCPEDKLEFKTDLAKFCNDMFYKAPEHLKGASVWSTFEHIMKKHIPEPINEWEKNIVGIYIGQTEVEGQHDETIARLIGLFE